MDGRSDEHLDDTPDSENAFMETDDADPASHASDDEGSVDYVWQMDEPMDIREYMERMLVRERQEKEPLDEECNDAGKAKPPTGLAIDDDGTVPDEVAHESRAVPEPSQITGAETVSVHVARELQGHTRTEEGSTSTNFVHASAASHQAQGCAKCDFLHEHPEFLPKLRESANRNKQLIPELTTLLDSFENLRLGHVELVHRPHKGRYAELFRYFKDATTVVMADRYAVKEEWQLNDFACFCDALVMGCPCPNLRRIVVLTPEAYFLAPTWRGEAAPLEVKERVKQKWDELSQRLLTKHNVTLEHTDFDLHPRKFLSDDGKTIESDHGIQMDQRYDTDKRSSAGTFIYYRTRPDDPIPLPARKWLKPPSPQILKAPSLAAASSNATTMVQTGSMLQPTNTMSWAAKVASKASPQNVITRVIPGSSLASKPTTQPARGGAAPGMPNHTDHAEKAEEYDPPKYADQCVNWKNCVNHGSKPPIKRKRLCPYWHPQKVCTRKNCHRGAKKCSYAHPFCSDGGTCNCDPDKRNPQFNHLVPKGTM